MAVINGMGGKVQVGETPTDVANVRNWTLEHTAELKPYFSSTEAADGYTKRTVGPKSWSGSFEMYSEDGAVDLTDLGVGDEVNLQLLTATGHTINGSAIVSGVSYSVDIEGAENIVYTVSFEGNGLLTLTDTP